jgi:hypothetical protein
MPYDKIFINLACSVCRPTEKYRTSVFLYKPCPTATGSVCTNKNSLTVCLTFLYTKNSRSINYKKLMCFCNFSRINVSWRLEVDQRSNPSVLVGRFVRFLCSRRIGSFFIQLRIILMNIFLYVDHECTLISSQLIIDTNI